MFSLKDAVRKTILAVSLAAVTTSFFTGCNNDQPISSSDLYPPTTQTAEAPPSLTDDIDPTDPTTPDANTFSIKFKYWYDNPDVQEAQEKIPNPGGDDNGETFLHLAGLPIYTDPDGNEYIISGRTPVYLHNGKISSTESLLLRDESGNKVYAVSQGKEKIAADLATFDKYMSDNKLEQPKTLNERQAQDAAANESKEIVGNKPIYINNLKTDLTTDSGYISVMSVFKAVSELGYVNTSALADNKLEITLNTAAGFVTVKFNITGDKAAVSYSTGISGTTLDEGIEFKMGTDTILLTPDALEMVLGYDIEVYDEFINIVTDNHDIFSSNTVVDIADLFNAVDNAYDVDADDIDPQNPIPESKPGEASKPDEKPTVTQAKPSNNKTPDGKYDLAESDISNADGTYTQTEFNPDSIPAWSGLSDFTEDDWKYFSDKGTISNPSKIPYSEITLENAKDAFPFIGYTGEFPGYYQILPTDSAERIADKVYSNMIGHTNIGKYPELLQYHLYASEAEYQQALAEEKKAEEEARELDERIEEGRKDDKPIGGNLSTEEAWNFFDD